MVYSVTVIAKLVRPALKMDLAALMNKIYISNAVIKQCATVQIVGPVRPKAKPALTVLYAAMVYSVTVIENMENVVCLTVLVLGSIIRGSSLYRQPLHL